MARQYNYQKHRRYHFTFVNGSSDGAALTIYGTERPLSGVVRYITGAVRTLCKDTELGSPSLHSVDMDWVEGSTADEVLVKATELLQVRGYTGIQWVSERSSNCDIPEEEQEAPEAEATGTIG